MNSARSQSEYIKGLTGGRDVLNRIIEHEMYDPEDDGDSNRRPSSEYLRGLMAVGDGANRLIEQGSYYYIIGLPWGKGNVLQISCWCCERIIEG